MKPAFHESLRANNLDPIDAQNQDFDWQGLYERLREDATTGENDPRMAELVVRLLQMLLPASPGRVNTHRLGLRLVALAWVLNPGYFADCPSLRELAHRCQVKTKVLAGYTGHYSRFIQWRNRAQRHAWNWHQPDHAPAGGGNDPGKTPCQQPPASVSESSPKGKRGTFPLSVKGQRARTGKE